MRSESKAKQADLTGKLDKTSARIDQATATTAQLQQAIKKLEGEVAEMDAAEAEATKVRQGEHADYLKASSDFKLSAEAVAKAMEVLNNYYSSASLLQIRSTTNQPEFGGAKGDVGSTIVSVLEARMVGDCFSGWRRLEGGLWACSVFHFRSREHRAEKAGLRIRMKVSAQVVFAVDPRQLLGADCVQLLESFRAYGLEKFAGGCPCVVEFPSSAGHVVR